MEYTIFFLLHSLKCVLFDNLNTLSILSSDTNKGYAYEYNFTQWNLTPNIQFSIIPVRQKVNRSGRTYKHTFQPKKHSHRSILIKQTWVYGLVKKKTVGTSLILSCACLVLGKSAGNSMIDRLAAIHLLKVCL